MKCISCKKNIEVEKDWVKFACPKCKEDEIVRCKKCKKVVNQYKCGKCGFEGP